MGRPARLQERTVHWDSHPGNLTVSLGHFENKGPRPLTKLSPGNIRGVQSNLHLRILQVSQGLKFSAYRDGLGTFRKAWTEIGINLLKK